MGGLDRTSREFLPGGLWNLKSNALFVINLREGNKAGRYMGYKSGSRKGCLTQPGGGGSPEGVRPVRRGSVSEARPVSGTYHHHSWSLVYYNIQYEAPGRVTGHIS